MKTIGEAAKIFSDIKSNGKHFMDLQIGFEAGAEFAQLWIPVGEELPTAIEAGCWVGMRSDFVLAKDNQGEWHKARVYAGFMDGSEFCDWADQNDYDLENIVEWRPIELK